MLKEKDRATISIYTDKETKDAFFKNCRTYRKICKQDTGCTNKENDNKV